MKMFNGYAITHFSSDSCSAHPSYGVGHPLDALTYTLLRVGTPNDTYLCQCECGDSRKMWTYAKRKKR